MKKKSIWDYFNEKIEYPKEVAHETLPYGTVWCYISSTFLNGMINYVKPISCFVVDRYTHDDEEVGAGSSHFKWDGSKRELIDAIIAGEKEIYHTYLNCFSDDIIILTKIETNKDDDGLYMFFWFDCDVSDCCIGKFKTKDKEEDVIQSVKNWLDDNKEDNKGLKILPNTDNGILNYTELPLSFLRGWIKF